MRPACSSIGERGSRSSMRTGTSGRPSFGTLFLSRYTAPWLRTRTWYWDDGRGAWWFLGAERTACPFPLSGKCLRPGSARTRVAQVAVVRSVPTPQKRKEVEMGSIQRPSWSCPVIADLPHVCAREHLPPEPRVLARGWGMKKPSRPSGRAFSPFHASIRTRSVACGCVHGISCCRCGTG